ncbi:MAG TPA: lipid-A-disaccharide synthase, partial [Luteibaculaceae bacterium]|nr:lipid-A-disaccharide synthase [Luteibaculaceae bacterium]
QGVRLIKHYREMDFMGFVEVIRNLSSILQNIKNTKNAIASERPDVLVLVDYPGFNLRIAPYAKKLGIKVVYYISPQIWAWKENRVHLIKKVVDKMLVILPFEAAFYQKHHFEVNFVGHPLLDAIAQYELANPSDWRTGNGLDDRPIVALLPGSRAQEIAVKLPIMLEVSKHFPQYQFVVAKAPSQPVSFYQQWLNGSGVRWVENQTYALLKNSVAACVTSGTATLETALFEVPQVVCYKGSAISYQIAKRLIKVKYISLVNLIMDAPVVTELIQSELNAPNLKRALNGILDEKGAQQMKSNYRELALRLGGVGASERASKIIVNDL